MEIFEQGSPGRNTTLWTLQQLQLETIVKNYKNQMRLYYYSEIF